MLGNWTTVPYAICGELGLRVQVGNPYNDLGCELRVFQIINLRGVENENKRT